MARIGFGVDGLGRKGHETLRKVAAVGDTGNAPLPGSVFTLRQVRLLKLDVGRVAGIDLPVAKDASVAAMSLDGDRLALHLTSSEGLEIVVIDLGSSKVVARVRLKPQ